jgi:hypothetical protein
MGIARVRRWQWVVIGLVVGFAVARVRESWGPFAYGDFGECMNDQKAFEHALVADHDGAPLFKDVAVYPVRLDGGRETVHLVSGTYYDGSATVGADGRAESVWRPRCYVARIPYPAPAGAAAAAGSPSSYTVVDYLDGLRGQGVSYTYTWWYDPRWATAAWTAGSFAMIGLVWPTVINLLVFGSPLRPREARGVSLAGVKGSGVSRAAEAQPAPDDASAAIADLDEELAAGVITSQRETVPSTPAPVRQLDGGGGELPAPAVAVAGQAKSFGRDADDYYPTELHGRAAKSKSGNSK